MKKILFVTAHADDWEGHAGGLAIKLHAAGHHLVSIVTTAGQRGQFYGDRPAVAVRTEESINAHRLLGLTPIFLARYEQALDVTAATREEFVKLVQGIKPDMVVTHWPLDVNPDHRATALLAMEQALQKGVNIELLFFEACSSGRSSTAIRPQTLAFFPTHYLDVSDPLVMAKKKAMVYCHLSQDPEGMWLGQLKLQPNRGDEAGVQQAEAYIRATRWGPLDPELAPLFLPTPFNLPRPIGVDFTPEAIGLPSS